MSPAPNRQSPRGLGTMPDQDDWDGTPILDLEPSSLEALTPEWLTRSRPPTD